MFLNWKNQYCENDYIIQSNLQIQCNPYQITNGARTENFTICMKTQKTPNSHRNLEKEDQTGRTNLYDFRLFYKAIVIKTVWY